MRVAVTVGMVMTLKSSFVVKGVIESSFKTEYPECRLMNPPLVTGMSSSGIPPPKTWYN